MVVTTTERLTLRTFLRTDLPQYAALNRDPEVVKYLGGPLTRADSDDVAAYANDLHAREGIGLLAVERTTDSTFVGMCGVHELDWYPDDVEVGWRLARPLWGHGYADRGGPRLASDRLRGPGRTPRHLGHRPAQHPQHRGHAAARHDVRP